MFINELFIILCVLLYQEVYLHTQIYNKLTFETLKVSTFKLSIVEFNENFFPSTMCVAKRNLNLLIIKFVILMERNRFIIVV